MVDVWGGFADAARTIPWQRDTITNVWSVTKTMTALCALVLADRGELDLDAPVARYWPEFARRARRRCWSGTCSRTRPACPPGRDDRASSTTGTATTARLAAQAPRVGAGHARPATTRSPRASSSARWSAGSPAGAWASSSPAEVAGPLGADFHIGLPAEHDDRVALVVPPPGRDRGLRRAAPGRTEGPAGTQAASGSATGTAWPGGARRSPRRSGFGNARSVALVQSVLACGGAVRGVRLLSPAGA